jgi:flagellar hook-associated protein FlgK
MSDILSISGSAVAAYQRALGTTSNNIANLSTVGYSRQSVDMSAGAPQAIGQIYVGTGVQVTGIKRSYDQFIEGTLRNAYSGLNTQGPLVQYANRIIDVMGSQNVGLTSALDQFFASAQSLSGDPASIDLRGQFLRDAGGVVGRLHELNTQLEAIQADSRGQIDADVGKLNELSKQLAYVNSQLQKNSTSASQPPELMDQRDN